MGNFLKIKLGVIICSLSILVLVPLLESNFNAPVTYKKWQQLSWDDFQGFAKPFTGWGAGISSTVKIEWDSVEEIFISYAIQNNQRSWRRKDLNDPSYGLNHEQYHFNITEIHARIMNQYLDSIQKMGNDNFRDRFIRLKFELNKMQDLYDNESDHSLNLGMQRRWEYKIDSMLLHYSNQSGIVTDYYSGAQVYFPTETRLNTNRKQGKFLNRLFFAKNYSMFLGLSSSRLYMEESFLLNDRILKYYEDYAIDVVSIETINSNFEFERIVVGKDSVNNTLVDKWVYEDENLYKLSTMYPKCDDSEEIGFEGIVDSFFRSLQIIDMEDHWFSKLDTVNFEISDYNEVNPGFCTVDNPPNLYGFIAGPFVRDSVGLLLVVDYGELTKTIHKNMIRIGNKIKFFEPGVTDQIYFLPFSQLPKQSFLLEYGFLEKDSIENCFQFKYQLQWIDRKEHEQ